MSNMPALEAAVSTEAKVADLGVFVSNDETKTVQGSASSDDGAGAAPPLDPYWSMPLGQAANDDREYDAQMARLRYARSRRQPFLLASVATALWAALIYSYAAISGRAPALHDLLAPEGLLFLLIVGAPAGLFFIIAGILRRMAEAQMHAEGLVGVMRSLSQPDARLPEQVASLGAGIRREIASISNAVERVIGRAAELEGHVRAEIVHLETAYREGERRVSNVLTQLRDERLALTGHADSSAEAIRKVRQALSAHVDMECSRLLNSVGDAENRFSEVVSTHSATFKVMMNSRCEQLGLDIESKTAEILTRFIASLGEVGDQLLDSLKKEAKAQERASIAVGEQLHERLEALRDNHGNVFDKAAVEAAKHFEASNSEAFRLLNELSESVAQALYSKQVSLVEEMSANASELAIQTRDTIRSDLSTAMEENFEQFRLSMNVERDALLQQVRTFEEELKMFKDTAVQTRAFDAVELANLPHEIRGALMDGVGSLTASAQSATETLNISAQKHLNALETSVARRIGEQRDAVEMLLTKRISELNANIFGQLEYIHGLLFDAETGLCVHIREGQTSQLYRIEELGKVLSASMNKAVFDLREPLELIIGTVNTIQNDTNASRTVITSLQHNLAQGAPTSSVNSERWNSDLKGFSGLAASISSAVQELENTSTTAGPPKRQGPKHAFIRQLPKNTSTTAGTPKKEVPKHAIIRQLPSSGPAPLQQGWLSDLLARASKEP